MATAIQRRRGTTSQHSTFTGLAGEITIDTDLNTIIVHDGSTAGGYRLAKYTEVQAAAAGDITSVVAGSGLTGGTTSGDATISLDYENLTGNLVPSANNTYSLGSLTSVWKDVFIGPGSLYVNGSKVIEDSSGTIQFTADTNQNISILTTGSGDIELTTGGDIQLKSNVVMTAGKSISTAGGGATEQGGNIDMNSNHINNVATPVLAGDAASKSYVDAQVDTADALGELSGDTDDITEGSSNLFYTVARANSAIDAKFSSNDTDNLSEGSTNLYYTDARADARVDAGFSNKDTDDLSEGSTNLYYTDARSQAAITVTDAGGDGSLGYSGGTITYTGPSATETRAHFSAGTGVTITDGEVAIGQAIATSSSPTFADLVLSGNLTVNGTTTTINSATVQVDDAFFRVNADGADIDAGFEANIGGAIKQFTYDTSENEWTFGSEPVKSTGGFEGDLTGDVTGSGAAITDLNASNITSGTISDARLPGTITSNLTGDVTGDLTGGVTGDVVGDVTGTVSSIANHSTSDLSEGTNLYHTTARANSAIDAYVTAGTGITVSSGTIATTITQYTDSDARSALSGGTGITYNSGTGEIALTDTGYVTGVTAGAGMTGGGASGTVTLNVIGGDGITVSADEVTTDDTYIKGLFSAGGDLSYSDGVFSFTNDAGDIESVTAGTGLSGGGTSGAVTLNVSGLTVSELAGGSLQTSGESFANNDTTLMTSAAIEDKILSYGYTTNVGDITGVTAGSYLTGGGGSGSVTLNVDATTAATASKIVARDSSGDVFANLFQGTATSARYADLAEKYESDEILEAGTVVCFGGDKEVTACEEDAHHSVAGVISTEPAYMMNSDAEGQYVALTGRVPCKVVGPVAKGDLLVSSSVKGHAKADNNAPAGRIIGKAIGSSDSGEAVIEVLVNMM